MRKIEVSEADKAEAIAAIAGVVPKGFYVMARPTDKPGQIRAVITGPRTIGHSDGEVVVSFDLARHRMGPDFLSGTKRSCQLWAQEPLSPQGEALEAASDTEKPAPKASKAKIKPEAEEEQNGST